MFKKIMLAGLIAAISVTVSANNKQPTDSKRHYERVQSGEFISSNLSKNTELEVVYFFNHNCTACQHFSPIIMSWYKAVDNERISLLKVPVPTNPSWAWATVLELATQELKPDFDTAIFTEELRANNAKITSKDEVIAFLMNRVGVDYITAEEYSSIERYHDEIETITALFESMNAQGTPNVGIVTKQGDRFIVGPQHNRTFNEMISTINGVTSFYLEYSE